MRFLCFLCFRCFWCFWFVRNLFVNKNKEFKTALITSFILLLQIGQNNSIHSMSPAFWSTDTSIFYYCDINLFLVYDAWCTPCNICLLLSETTPGVSLYLSLTLEKNVVAVITQDRAIADNLKKQIKTQTFCPCRLFLLN